MGVLEIFDVCYGDNCLASWRYMVGVLEIFDLCLEIFDECLGDIS